MTIKYIKLGICSEKKYLFLDGTFSFKGRDPPRNFFAETKNGTTGCQEGIGFRTFSSTIPLSFISDKGQGARVTQWVGDGFKGV